MSDGHTPSPGAAPGQADVPDSGSQNEFIWTVKRLWILLRCWSVPVGPDPLNEFPPSDRAGARATALILIVVLAFAVRSFDPDQPNSFGYGSATTVTVLAGACAAVLSGIIDFASRRISLQLREYTVISAYASTLLIMLLYVFFDQVFYSTIVGYEMAANTYGRPLVAVLWAAPVCAALWTTKVFVFERKTLSGKDALHSYGVILGSAVVVFAVAEIPQDLFNWAVSHLAPVAPT